MEQPNYIGVYHNTNDNNKAQVPFRVAIRRGRPGQQAQWVNCGYFRSERVAARVYNMYAVCFFGDKAILNDVQPTPEEVQEFQAFVHAEDKPNRAKRLAQAREVVQRAVASGKTFRKHTEVIENTPVQQSLVG